MAELAEQYARPRALEFNIGEGEQRNDTGVRFEDVAGIDKVKSNIIEVLKMMRGDERYKQIGAKAPKVVFEQINAIRIWTVHRASCWKDHLAQARRIWPRPWLGKAGCHSTAATELNSLKCSQV